ncbi:MAG: sulfatase-like hydrolase/transferase, partial [Cytophagales bacterium]|nr:sulfatase-like hydrolase/transferase [Cytophagales bacterium]
MLKTSQRSRKISRARILLLVGALLCPGYFLAQQESKPSIVLIIVDDLGWTDTGFNGSQYYETPYMDQLALEGANFTQAYAASAVCSPTRASI